MRPLPRSDRRLLLWTFGPMALMLIGFGVRQWILDARFTRRLVCSRCFLLQTRTEQQLPWFPFAAVGLERVGLWGWETPEVTPLSRLVSEELAGPHGHDWILAWGSGNGIR